MKQEDIALFGVALPEDIEKAKWAGDFVRAKRLIRVRLEDSRVPAFMKKRLVMEQEVLDRLQTEYTLTPRQGLDLIRRKIPDFTMEELEHLMDTSAVDWIYKEGKPCLAARFFNTLTDVYPDIAKRAGIPTQDPETFFRMQEVERIRRQGSSARRIRIRSTITIKKESFRPGRVLVHLPIPKEQPNMTDIRILSVQPTDTALIGSMDQGQRTVSWNEDMSANHPFIVEYEYVSRVVYRDLSQPFVPAEGKAYNEGYTDADLELKAPHMEATPTLRALKDELVRGKTSKLEMARAFYDFCTTKVVYSYMRDYFELEEITDYVAAGLKGDCGVQALLFITLCRMAGIPARWQSGLYVVPALLSDGRETKDPGQAAQQASAGAHDWAMFYIEPWGWLFADPSFGGSAYRAGRTDQWNFYFGNLDTLRMAANSEFQAALVPDKNFTRNDPYDNQLGEIEYEDRGLISKDRTVKNQVLECRLLSSED